MHRLIRPLCNGFNLTNSVKNACRSLYTANSLGLDGYIERRSKVQQYFVNDSDGYREKMRGLVTNDGTSMIFTEDLKNMAHLTEPNEQDIELLEKMVRKFHKQSKEARFGNFIFGPVVMRCLHNINQPDVALRLFKDSEFDGFFDQLVTYQILCDMLYEHGRYSDIYDVYETIKSKQVQGGMNPRYVVQLVFAACYKENTAESFKYCAQLFTELSSVGHIPLRRAVTFAAALALKQNAPHVALEIVGTIRQQNYVTVRNVKVVAYAHLGRVEDALKVLRGVLQLHDAATKQTFSSESISALREAINQTANNELIQDFNKTEKFLIENGHVDNKTLDDYLTSPIDTRQFENNRDNNRDRTTVAASYNNNNRNYGNQNYGFKRAPYSGRTGLTDMD